MSSHSQDIEFERDSLQGLRLRDRTMRRGDEGREKSGTGRAPQKTVSKHYTPLNIKESLPVFKALIRVLTSVVCCSIQLVHSFVPFLTVL
jgi:hypothetical protein